MKAKANAYLNVRAGSPSVNAPKVTYINPGDQIEYTDVLSGDSYEGNDLWLKGIDGNYYWAGGAAPDPQWFLDSYAIRRLWGHTRGAGVKVAVLDTGVDTRLAPLKAAVVGGKNFVGPENDISDANGHGTHCAGIIGARGPQIFGVAPECSLLVGKVMQGGDTLDLNVLREAIQWALSEGAGVISMSLFSLDSSVEPLHTAIMEGSGRCLFVAAAGNQGRIGRDVEVYPASYKECISVGAVDQMGLRFERSNMSENLDVMAPGVDILSTFPSPVNIRFISDTSMAAAFVSGLLVLCRSLNSGISTLELINRLHSTADPHGVGGFDHEYGYGTVNPTRLVDSIQAMKG